MRTIAATSSCLGLAIVLGLSAVFGACSSENGDSAEDAGSSAAPTRSREALAAEAKKYFAEKVFPAISPICGPACHDGTGKGTPFMGPSADLTYDLMEGRVGLIAAPGKSPLVNWIHADEKLKNLPGPAELGLLRTWLQKEANARGLEGAVDKVLTLRDAYDRFGKCMNFELYSKLGMADLANAQTDLEGPCLGCHSGGQAQVYLSADPKLTFEQMRLFPFVQKLVVAKVDKNGDFSGLIASNRLIDKGAEPCEGEGCHPRYGLPPWAVKAVREFVTATLQNLEDGTCAIIPTDPIPVFDAGADR
jgi:hypothetical protein